MRRWFLLAALLAFLLGTSLWAQRGGRGGGGMGGGHVGSAAPARGGFGGSWHGGSGGSWNGSWGHPGHFPNHPTHFPYRPYFRFGYPYGYGYGYGYGYYGVPYGYGYWGDSSSYDNSQGYGYAAASNPTYVYVPYDPNGPDMYRQQEVEDLRNEVANLRAQQNTPSTQRYSSPANTQVHAETVLIFRDKHKEEIVNYAIVGKTLWVFTEQRARKIPVSELDIPATTKANDDRGISFSLPQS